MSDSSNAEVTLTLTLSADARQPPAVFVGHSLEGSRRQVHICIAEIGGIMRKIEFDDGDDDGSPLAPLLEYNGGACFSERKSSSRFFILFLLSATGQGSQWI